MTQLLKKLSMLLLTLRIGASALQVGSIQECPELATRSSSDPTDVTDLRPGDIKVIGALGDSTITGALMMDTDNGKLNTYYDYAEYRGNSYAVGGDPDAVTLATFFQYYSPFLEGSSVGERLATGCTDDSCYEFIREYHPLHDKLNAAMSGAGANDLEDQLDYLISRMKSMDGVDYDKDWKFITLQIGTVNMCGACDASTDNSVETYGELVLAALERIRTSIPRVIVNILGNFRESGIYKLTADAVDYCRAHDNDPETIFNRWSCPCYMGDDSNRTTMDELAEGYDGKLLDIYKGYKNHSSPTFAVRYQPMNVDLSVFPIDIVSNFDCFHPRLITQQWLAKVVWNSLFTSQQGVAPSGDLDITKTPVYCPTESDRIYI